MFLGVVLSCGGYLEGWLCPVSCREVKLHKQRSDVSALGEGKKARGAVYREAMEWSERGAI